MAARSDLSLAEEGGGNSGIGLAREGFEGVLDFSVSAGSLFQTPGLPATWSGLSPMPC